MLYLVATPIGNLKDISYRAIEVLEQCDIIACEDTRHTIKLLNHYNIKKELISYHEHNIKERGQELLVMAKEGKTIVLVSDAGCPAISDPGEDLVKLFHQHSLKVSVIPGPSASISALMISGLSTKAFVFIGFLPRESKKIKVELEQLKRELKTMIFYEAPHRLIKTLTTFKQFFGGKREIALVREITKIYEEVQKGSIDDMLDIYKEKKPRGEFVLILSGGIVEENTIKNNISIAKRYNQLLLEDYDKKDAMREIAKERNISRREVYAKLNK